MTITRPIGAASTFDTTREVQERRKQGPRGAATQVRTGVGGDRGHGGAQSHSRDTEAQARAFEGALARGGPQKRGAQAMQRAAAQSPPQPPLQRPSPFSGALSPGRQDGRQGGPSSDSPLHGLPRHVGAGARASADRTATGSKGGGWQRGDQGGDADDVADADDAISQHSRETRPDRQRETDVTAAALGGRDDGEQDRDVGGDSRANDDASSESVDTGDASAHTASMAGTASSGVTRSSSGLRDGSVPPNSGQSSDADRQGGNGDRDGFARHTQDALLAALTRPPSRPYGGPLPSSGTASPLYASPLSPAASGGREDVTDKAVLAVLRGMMDAIDALRVDVDGRRGVEMDISVPDTHGVTVRVEEAEGCLQTTLSCREAADARRLQPGVQTLADRLATRFVRAARVRIETSASTSTGDATAQVSHAHATDTGRPHATAGEGKHPSEAGRDLVAEAFAPLPSGESI